MCLTHLLRTLVAMPVVIGIALLFLPDKSKILIHLLGFVAAALSLAGSIVAFTHQPVSWYYGSRVILSADHLSAFIGIAVAFFALLVMVYSFKFIEKSPGRYFGYSLITLGSCLGVSYANNSILLLFFWGLLALMLYLLVNLEGTNPAAASAQKALIIIGATDVLLLFGIGIIWSISGSFSLSGIHCALSGWSAYVAYFSIAIACFAKAGAVPFHSWIPDVAENASIPVSAYFIGSLDKLLGIYFLTRVSVSLFAVNQWTNSFLLLIGSVTVIVAVLLALVQHDLKRLLGYHAVSQVGYMILGIGTGSALGIAGGLFHMLNNVVYKTCLFLSGGNVKKAAGTTNLDSLGGLAKEMPVTFGAFLIAALAISGIPPLNGFVSKWMIYQALIELGSARNPLWIVGLVAAIFGSALTLASFLKLVHAVFLGKKSEGLRVTHDPGLRMNIPVVILAALCIIFGIGAFAIPLRGFIFPAVGGAVSYAGVWLPGIATLLIAVSILIGVLLYSLFKAKTLGALEPFVGGENPAMSGRVSGTEFYNSIQELPLLRRFYRQEASGELDIYTQSKRAISGISGFFQYLHNGILPTYLAWCLLGIMAAFCLLFIR